MLFAVLTLMDHRFKKIAFSDFGIAAKVGQYIIWEIAASLRLEDNELSDGTEVEFIVADASYTNEKSLWHYFDQQVARASTTTSLSSELTIQMQQYLRLNNIERKDDLLSW